MLPDDAPDLVLEEGEPIMRSRFGWIGQHAGLEDAFLARCMGLDLSFYRDWLAERVSLSPEQLAHADDCWLALRHLYAFVNFEGENLRRLLEHRVPDDETTKYLPNRPAWCGSTLKDYLRQGTRESVVEVDRWITWSRRGRY